MLPFVTSTLRNTAICLTEMAKPPLTRDDFHASRLFRDYTKAQRYKRSLSATERGTVH